MTNDICACANGYKLVTRLAACALLGLLLQGCYDLRPCAPEQVRERMRVDADELVDDWRVNGATIPARFIHAAAGCYLLEVKYREDYKRVRGASSLWGISPLAAGIETAARTETSTYETGYARFALQLRNQHTYHVTATFDGDWFFPRILELNDAGERTREIRPVRTNQELDACKAKGPPTDDISDVACAGERDQSKSGLSSNDGVPGCELSDRRRASR